jgi:hypothetical protein
MRLLFSLMIVFSLLVVPVEAQAMDFCDSQGCVSFNQGCVSFNIDKDAGKSQPDSKSSAKTDHCCVCSHAASDTTFSKTGYIEPDSNKLFHFKDAALLGHEPQGLLRPP